MLRTIFNGVYLIMFIGFLRNFHRKIVPPKECFAFPRYLLLALCSDKAILLGYTDSYSSAIKYSSESRWSVTISEYVGDGYREVNVSGQVDADNSSSLESLRENSNGICMDKRDMELNRKYAVDEDKIAFLVRHFRNGNYI
jgi:hypothetical protein